MPVSFLAIIIAKKAFKDLKLNNIKCIIKIIIGFYSIVLLEIKFTKNQIKFYIILKLIKYLNK